MLPIQSVEHVCRTFGGQGCRSPKFGAHRVRVARMLTHGVLVWRQFIALLSSSATDFVTHTGVRMTKDTELTTVRTNRGCPGGLLTSSEAGSTNRHSPRGQLRQGCMYKPETVVERLAHQRFKSKLTGLAALVDAWLWFS